MILPAPVITRRQSTQHGRQNKKAYWVKNYQQSKHVYLGKLIVSTLLNTLWNRILIMTFILTVANGGSYDVYDIVSS